jgi:acetylglutamate kinase
MTQVIKVGGNELDDPTFVKGLVRALKEMPEPPVLVHGGGKEIRSLQERLGLEPQYIDGLRVTDLESLAVVQMVLVGRINKRLVAVLTAEGVDAFGMSGVDRGAVKAEKLGPGAGGGGSLPCGPRFLIACWVMGSHPFFVPSVGGQTGVCLT